MRPLMGSNKTRRRSRCIALLCVCLLLAACGACVAQSKLRFVVRFTPQVRSTPFTGRVLVMLGRPNGGEPRFGPNWFQPSPCFAIDVRGWQPGTELTMDDRALGYPEPLKALKPDDYTVQAVLDQQDESASVGSAPGNGYSKVVTAALDPAKPDRVELNIDQVVSPRPFPETDRLKLVEIPSPLLTRFYGKPTLMRAAVMLPEDYDRKPARRYPVVYIIPGFGGTRFSAIGWARNNPIYRDFDAIDVMLDPDCYTGHHVFADSANNGPRGQALITELIPYIEKTYRAIGKPDARFLNGHSSGGWSSLWLQITYPDFFGGVWSTSPDPVDFHDFQQIDLYAPGENFYYTDRQGKLRPVARRGTEPVLFIKPFDEMETIQGHGGQLGSFEAVFSPRGRNGKPQQLWNRTTGAIDPKVAKAWEKYDISLTLERNWSTLGPKLRGKLHVWTGGLDTFYLNGAVERLKERLARLGSDADIRIVPGKDHGSILAGGTWEKIAGEMKAEFGKSYPTMTNTETGAVPQRKDEYATVNGVRLHYVTQGSGQVALFLHGFPEFWYAWKDQLAEFGKTHQAIALDMRGYNLSDKPTKVEDYAIPTLLADIKAFLAQVSPGRKAILVAHDWGGALAWGYAALYPETLEKLVIINAPHPTVFSRELQSNPAQQKASAYMTLFLSADAEKFLSANRYAALVAGVFGSSTRPDVFTEEDRNAYLAAWAQPGALTGGLNYYRAAQLGPPSATDKAASALTAMSLPNIDVPTLVIWGEKDTALLTGNLEGLDRYVSHLTIKRIPNGSHWVVHEEPQTVNAMIRDFLK